MFDLIMFDCSNFLLCRGLRQEGFLIEATFSFWGYIERGVQIQYTYAVQKQHGFIEEIALRYVYVPPDKTVKGTEKC